MIEPGSNLPGGAHRVDPVYAVSNLASLFTVCAMALDGASSFRADIRDRLTKEIEQVLNMGALIAEDVALLVEREIGKGGAS
ncbi:hypothetical protein [Mesorhizobium sp. A623]